MANEDHVPSDYVRSEGHPFRVAWFVSNHGWGHLNRSMVVGEAFLRQGHALLMVVAPEMEPTVRSALTAAEVVTGDLDRGYALGAGGRGADPEGTRALLRYAADVDPRVLRAVEAWGPDVVASDATPWASRVAEALAVPSVVCSNFSWDDQYEALYDVHGGRADAPTAALEQIRAHVSAFTLALELPLGPGVPSARERQTVPLVSRWPSRRTVSLPGTGELITWAFGRTPLVEQPVEGLRRLVALGEDRGIRVAAASRVADAVPGTIAIPDGVYWPDVLTASRLVISKAGYSTLAETLRGPAHVVSIGITGLPEERGMQRAIEVAGHGLAVPLGVADTVDAVVRHAEELVARSGRKPLAEDGSTNVVDAVAALLVSHEDGSSTTDGR